MGKVGEVRNTLQVCQLQSFEKLCFGSISPTDIDAFLDFGNKVFVFIELKYRGRRMPFGQQLALRRLCDACSTATRKAYLLVARHETDGVIDVAATEITQVWHNGCFWWPKKEIEVRRFCEKSRNGEYVIENDFIQGAVL